MLSGHTARDATDATRRIFRTLQATWWNTGENNAAVRWEISVNDFYLHGDISILYTIIISWNGGRFLNIFENMKYLYLKDKQFPWKWVCLKICSHQPTKSFILVGNWLACDVFFASFCGLTRFDMRQFNCAMYDSAKSFKSEQYCWRNPLIQLVWQMSRYVQGMRHTNLYIYIYINTVPISWPRLHSSTVWTRSISGYIIKVRLWKVDHGLLGNSYRNMISTKN